MSTYGLLIDYQWCSGCHSCEVACKQEHSLPAGVWGIKVYELVQEYNGKIYIDYFPFPTDLCNLCANRTKENKLPACVQHCMAHCMDYGNVEELVKRMNGKPKMVLWVPRQ